MSSGIRYKFLEHKVNFFPGVPGSVTSDLGGNSGCRAGIVGMKNCNWGNLTEELRLWLMDLERKLRLILRINQVVLPFGERVKPHEIMQKMRHKAT